LWIHRDVRFLPFRKTLVGAFIVDFDNPTFENSYHKELVVPET
jgi:hypothetical protein